MDRSAGSADSRISLYAAVLASSPGAAGTCSTLRAAAATRTQAVTHPAATCPKCNAPRGAPSGRANSRALRFAYARARHRGNEMVIVAEARVGLLSSGRRRFTERTMMSASRSAAPRPAVVVDGRSTSSSTVAAPRRSRCMGSRSACRRRYTSQTPPAALTSATAAPKPISSGIGNGPRGSCGAPR